MKEPILHECSDCGFISEVEDDEVPIKCPSCHWIAQPYENPATWYDFWKQCEELKH